MQKLLLFIMAFVVCANMYAQQEIPAYHTAITQFQSAYGGGSVDSLYLLFSREKRENASPGDTKVWLSDLKNKYGRITEVSFLKQDASFASYKIKFGKGVRVLTLSLDKEDKIAGLVFRPFDPEEFPDAEADEEDREPNGKKEQ